MATRTYPTSVLTDRMGHVFEFKDNEIREQMAELISKTETSIASANEALNAAENAQAEATSATEYMEQVAESVAAAVETAQAAAEAAETAQQALEDIVVTDTNGVAGTAGADQPLQSVLDGATKPVSQYPATTAPLASTDLIIIEKANGTRSKMTYDQLIAAISNQVINKTFTSGALANYLVNDANATTAGQRALDAKMGNTLNAAISQLNSRLVTVSDFLEAASGVEIDSSSKIYKAEKHIWGQVIFHVTTWPDSYVLAWIKDAGNRPAGSFIFPRVDLSSGTMWGCADLKVYSYISYQNGNIYVRGTSNYDYVKVMFDYYTA